jgi:hypothetical protein
VVGRAVGVERLADGARVEMAPDREYLGAIRLLCSAASGEPTPFRGRQLRYLVRLPMVVNWSGGRFLTDTVSISEDGCAVRWSTRLPTKGQVLDLTITTSGQAQVLRGVVCWSDPGGRAGLRLLPMNGARALWHSLLAEAARAGATAT